jgi:DNA-binding NarL/FixJ family response regulator
MPRMDGTAATARIRASFPGTEIVVLTTHADDASISAALQAGARGYLTKDAGLAQITEALRHASTHRTALDPVVQERLVAGLAGARPPARLTEREAEVLRLIAEGLSNQEIADRLVVSPATVKSHINHLFAKTAVRDRAQAVAYAYRHGLAP